MAEDNQSQYQQNPQPQEIISFLHDLEEKQNLLKDRVILLGKTLVEERDKTFHEIQELKSSLIKLTEESKRMRELLERITEQLTNVARKEELSIIQRQIDMLRE
ncbi:MAG: hypothetical protein N3D20_01460 [Candidatus Pacearchaeota archaeon]|nr:hypothetical protein [Candidatus Pacearchaeota archaeon]